MIEKVGNIMTDRLSISNSRLVFTANSILDRNRALIMGAGIAKAVRDAFPGINYRLGVEIEAQGLEGGIFHLLEDKITGVIALQTKIHWRDPSPLHLVLGSCHALNVLAWSSPETQFLMTRPGCGQGGLSWENKVRPNLRLLLPDNVTVYSL